MSNVKISRANNAVKKYCNFSRKEAISSRHGIVNTRKCFVGKIIVEDGSERKMMAVFDGKHIELTVNGEFCFSDGPIYVSDSATIQMLNGTTAFTVEIFGFLAFWGTLDKEWACAFFDVPVMEPEECKSVFLEKYRQAYELSTNKTFIDTTVIQGELNDRGFEIFPHCAFRDIKIQLFSEEKIEDVFVETSDGEYILPWVSPENVISFGKIIVDPFCVVYVKTSKLERVERDCYANVCEFDEFTYERCVRLFSWI